MCKYGNNLIRFRRPLPILSLRVWVLKIFNHIAAVAAHLLTYSCASNSVSGAMVALRSVALFLFGPAGGAERHWRSYSHHDGRAYASSSGDAALSPLVKSVRTDLNLKTLASYSNWCDSSRIRANWLLVLDTFVSCSTHFYFPACFFFFLWLFGWCLQNNHL